jgi:hypothetical protein
MFKFGDFKVYLMCDLNVMFMTFTAVLQRFSFVCHSFSAGFGKQQEFL